MVKTVRTARWENEGKNRVAKTFHLLPWALVFLALNAVAGDRLSELVPPATSEEVALYEEFKSDPAAEERFITTRKFVRRYNANPDNPGPIPEIDWGAFVDGEEQYEFFKIVTDIKLKKIREGNAPSK